MSAYRKVIIVLWLYLAFIVIMGIIGAFLVEWR